MTDSVVVFPPAFRVLDANGDPVNNAKIKFRAIGPGATREVFSDAGLSVSLGHTVRTRSDGFPVVSEGSNTTVLIYTGSTPYHIEITDSDDVAIFPAKDNVSGAVDTSEFLTDADTSTLNIPVLSKTANYTIQEADKGKLIAANANGGFFSLTLPSAITVGDGWNVGIRNDGTSNAVGIISSQAVATSMGALTAFSLRVGETIWIESNGATFKTSGYTPTNFIGTVGRLLIADRLSTPPVGPSAGARYILTSLPVDAWATFAEHDIAEADGQGGWFKITPATDVGLIAYVQDEDRYYTFKGSAWVDIVNTIRAADMPAGSLCGRAYNEYVANSDISTVIPLDDTIPQSGEGTEILTVTVTLAKSTNRVRLRFQGFGEGNNSGTGNTAAWIAAMFISGTANALAAGINSTEDGDVEDASFQVVLEFEHAPGSVGPHTYTVRVGPSATGTLRMNGTSVARYFGGAARATLVLEEIAT